LESSARAGEILVTPTAQTHGNPTPPALSHTAVLAQDFSSPAVGAVSFDRFGT
jgi:hypothetical protein